MTKWDGPFVQVENLTKNYWRGTEKISVLQGVNLEINAGDRISVIGASGSGKSTFLHVVGTLDNPSEGIVRFRGENIFEKSSAALAAFRNQTIGFVFQFHHLLPEFSALENTAMPALIRRMSAADAEDRAAQMLQKVGLGHRMKHRPGELSGGEQQRVAIARALVMEPPLLFADEPTGNLDEVAADGIHALLDSMHEETGLTVVLVTHSSKLAAKMPRRFIMRDGQLQPA